MADYFTYFSVILPLNKEQKEYAVQLVEQIQDFRSMDTALPTDFPADLIDAADSWTFEAEATPDGLWFHSQEGGQEAACVFIQHLLQKFDFAPSMAFEWSHDCSKPKTDAYGGGAAFITASEIETFSTSEWLQKMTR